MTQTDADPTTPEHAAPDATGTDAAGRAAPEGMTAEHAAPLDFNSPPPWVTPGMVYADVRRNPETGELRRRVWYGPTTHHDFTTDLDVMAYVVAVRSAAYCADYEWAIRTQFDTPESTMRDKLAAKTMVDGMVAKLGTHTWQAGAMTLQPGVDRNTMDPLVHADLPDEQWMVMTPEAMNAHADHVLDTFVQAPFHIAYVEHLTDPFGLNTNTHQAGMLVNLASEYVELRHRQLSQPDTPPEDDEETPECAPEGDDPTGTAQTATEPHRPQDGGIVE